MVFVGVERVKGAGAGILGLGLVDGGGVGVGGAVVEVDSLGLEHAEGAGVGTLGLGLAEDERRRSSVVLHSGGGVGEAGAFDGDREDVGIAILKFLGDVVRSCLAGCGVEGKKSLMNIP